jgi:hypothetical protein
MNGAVSISFNLIRIGPTRKQGYRNIKAKYAFDIAIQTQADEDKATVVDEAEENSTYNR